MNKLSTLISLTLLASGSVLAQTAIEGLPESPYQTTGTAPSALAALESARPGAAKAAEVHLEDYPEITTSLSPGEQAMIEAKREAIVQYLYERQELQGLRDVLRDAQHKDAVQDQLRERVPLTPDEILMVRKALRDAALAENAPLKNPPRLQMRTVDLDIDGQQPLELYVAKGYSSSIVFFDETGAPWPLQSGIDALGDDSAFSAQTVSEQGHVATFQIKKEFSQSNALVILQGLPVPVVMRLIGSDNVVDSRLSVRVPRHGPNAEIRAVYRNEVDNAPPDMMAFLNGEKLPGSVPYQLVGVPGEVVKKGNELYLRTRARLLSPAPIVSLVSATGYNVYTLPPITHLLFTVDGSTREARIERMYVPTLATPEDIFADAEDAQ